MNFLSLPVEIGSKIIDYLNLKDQINMYNSCEELREYFLMWCHPRKVVLSRNTLASAKTLEERLISDLGMYILELDLSGVPDLTVDNLKPHVHSFVNLKTLDVTFTNIDLADISDICPQNLKNIGINFFKNYHFYTYGYYNYERITEESKNIFKTRQFESVHFVIMKFKLSASPYKFLKDIKIIKDLKVTIADNDTDFFSIDEEGDNQIDINFDKLTVIARDCAVTHKISKLLDGVARLNFKQLEYIFMMSLEDIEIYVSPLLSKLFSVNCHDVKVQVSSYLPQNFMLDGNIVFKAWNKETTIFDEDFFKDLLVTLKNYFPTYKCMHSNEIMKVVDSPNDWCSIDKCENFDKLDNLPNKITLTEFCRRSGVFFRCRRPISLAKSNRLQHLTFLKLNNIPIRNVFFGVLFEQCPNLVTLDIYMENVRVNSYLSGLIKSIHLAKLKNFILTSKDIQFEVVFRILSRCNTLENVCINEYEREIDDCIVDQIEVIPFIVNCVNLYSLFIEVALSPESLTMLMGSLRTAAQRCERDYLNIEVCYFGMGWNPFADVFSPSPLCPNNNL